MLVKNFYITLGYGAQTYGSENSFCPHSSKFEDNYPSIINPENKRIVQQSYDKTEGVQKLVQNTFSNGERTYLHPYQLTGRRQYESSDQKCSSSYSNFRSYKGNAIDITTDQISTDYRGGGGYASGDANCNTFIILGSGTTAPTINDYKLENCNLDYKIQSYTQSFGYISKMFTAMITITPNSDGTVNEIGLYGLPADGYFNLGYSSNTVITNGLALLARKVFDNPIEIKKDKTYVFTYNVDLMNISDN